MEGLYTGLGTAAVLQLDAKIKLLVEAPAAVEDALASLLNHHDVTLQVAPPTCPNLNAACMYLSSYMGEATRAGFAWHSFHGL